MHITESPSGVEVGDTFNFYQHPKTYKAHIISIVDDVYGFMVVYKWYGAHKQWWHFEVKHMDDIVWMIERHKALKEDKQ